MTDIHHSLDRVDQLKSWLAAGNLKCDVVLVSGDIANAPMDWSLTQEQQEKYRKDMEAVLDTTAQITDKIYFIPGNVGIFHKWFHF